MYGMVRYLSKYASVDHEWLTWGTCNAGRSGMLPPPPVQNQSFSHCRCQRLPPTLGAKPLNRFCFCVCYWMQVDCHRMCMAVFQFWLTSAYQQRPDRIMYSIWYRTILYDTIRSLGRMLQRFGSHRSLSTRTTSTKYIPRDTLFILFHRWLTSRYAGSDEALSSCHDLSWFIVALHVGAVVVHIRVY